MRIGIYATDLSVKELTVGKDGFSSKIGSQLSLENA